MKKWSDCTICGRIFCCEVKKGRTPHVCSVKCKKARHLKHAKASYARIELAKMRNKPMRYNGPMQGGLDEKS